MNIIKKINDTGKIIVAICIILSIITLTVIITPGNTKETVATTSTLSNEKIGWGIKRNDNNMQPDLGSKNKLLIEKYNGIAMGKEDSKNIYLTFDLGYEAGYTNTILDALKERGVKGTFFITAHYLNTAPEIVERMIREGHIVGNHIPYTLMTNLKI